MWLQQVPSLGIAMHSNDSFPVGKVDFMDLYPLSFSEFLEAVGQEAFARLLAKKDWGHDRCFSF